MKKKQIARAAAGALLLIAAGIAGCQLVKPVKPAGAAPVTPFDAARYLGTWYEIARFDYRFERGLEQVTANYSQKGNGAIRVENRGFKTGTGDHQHANPVCMVYRRPFSGS